MSLSAITKAIQPAIAQRPKEDWWERAQDQRRKHWETIADHYARTGYWSDTYGTRPGLPGCMMPRDLQASVIAAGAPDRDPGYALDKAMALDSVRRAAEKRR